MAAELTREQLLEYIKKQKAKIKKLESDLTKANSNALTQANSASSASSAAAVDPTADLINAGWSSFSSFVSSVAAEVNTVVANSGELQTASANAEGGADARANVLSRLEATVTEKTLRISQLELQLSSLQERAKQQDNVLDEKGVEIACDKELIEVLRAQVIQLEKDLSAATTANSNANANATTGTGADADAGASSAEAALKQIEGVRHELEARISDLSTQLKAKTDEADSSKTKIQKFSAAVKAKIKEVESLQASSHEATERHARELSVERARIQELTNALSAAETATKSSSDNTSSAETARIQELVSALADKTSAELATSQKLAEALAATAAANELHTSSSAAAQAQVQKLTEALAAANKASAADSEAATKGQLQAESQAKDLRQKLDTAEKSLAETKSKIEKLQKRAEELQARETSREASAAEMLAEKKRMLTQLQEAQALSTSLQAALVQSKNDHQSVETTQAELQRLSQQLLSSNQEKETVEKSHSSTTAALKQVELKMAASSAEVARLEKALRTSQDETAALRKSASDATAKIENLEKGGKQERAKAAEEVAALSSEVGRLTSLLAAASTPSPAAPVVPSPPALATPTATPPAASTPAVVSGGSGKKNKKGKGGGQAAPVASPAVPSIPSPAPIPDAKESTKKEEERLTAELAALRTELAAAHQQCSFFEKQIAALTNANKQLEESKALDATNLSSALESARAEIAALSKSSARVAELEGQTKTLEAQMSKAQKASEEEAEAQKLRADKAENEILILCENVVQVETQVREVSEKHAKAEAIIKLQTQELEKVKAALQTSQAKEESLSALETEVKSLEEKARASKELASKTMERLKSANAELAECKAKLAANEADNTAAAALVESTKNLQAAQQKIVDETNRAKQATEALAASKSAHANECLTLKSSFDKSQSECAALNKRIESLTKDAESLSRDAATAREEREWQRRRVLELEGVVEGLEKHSQKQSSDELSTALKETANLREELVLAKTLETASKAVTAQHLVEIAGLKEAAAKAVEKASQADQSVQKLEAKGKALEKDLAEARSKLEVAVKEAQANAKALEAVQLAVEVAQSARGSEEENAAREAVVSDLKSRVATLQGEKLSLEQSSARERADNETKVKALVDKVSRLKALLQKGNTLAQEREKEMERLAQEKEKLAAERAEKEKKSVRAKRFGVQTAVELPLFHGAEESKSWCLIFEDAAPGKESSCEQRELVRWVDQSTLQQWLAEGSSLIGDWPEPLHARFSKDLAALRARLEGERDVAKREIEDISATFAAYKSRAQTALKRLGQEERQQRQESGAEVGSNSGNAQQRQQEQDWQETLAEAELQLLEARRENLSLGENLRLKEAEVASLRSAFQELQKASENGATELATLRVALEKALVEAKEAREAKQGLVAAATATATASAAAAAAAAVTAAADEQARATAAASSKQKQEQQLKDEDTSAPAAPLPPLPPSAFSITQAQARGHRDSEPRETLLSVLQNVVDDSGAKVTPSDASLAATKTPTKQRLLLYQQAENELQSGLAIARQENATLSSALREAQRIHALSEEQVLLLKDTIRDLEQALIREREFNSESTRINVEYLTNVLRKFLSSNNVAERAKLALVVCQVLHLRADETKAIVSRWEALAGGGFLGALFNPRQVVSGMGPTPGGQAVTVDTYMERL